MRLRFEVEVPESMSARAVQRMMREAHRAVGRYWQDNLLAKAFRPGAAQRHDHKPRSKKYLARKRRLAKTGRVKMDGVVDLVYSGDMRTLLKNRGIIKSFPTRASLTLQGPRYVSMKPFRRDAPNLGEEVTSLSSGERTELDGVFERAAEDAMKKETQSKRVRP